MSIHDQPGQPVPVEYENFLSRTDEIYSRLAVLHSLLTLVASLADQVKGSTIEIPAAGLGPVLWGAVDSANSAIEICRDLRLPQSVCWQGARA